MVGTMLSCRGGGGERENVRRVSVELGTDVACGVISTRRGGYGYSYHTCPIMHHHISFQSWRWRITVFNKKVIFVKLTHASARISDTS